MLSVLANWIYVIVTTYLLGHEALKLIVNIPVMYTDKGRRKSVYVIKRRDSALIAGLVVACIYSQLFSLFGGVGLWANIILIIICLAIFLRSRDEFINDILDFLIRGKNTGALWAYLVLMLVFAYGTSHGLIHYDSDLYHAQAIRWIEEYGAVKGLGNLHLRLGYNSASFALSALYSMGFTGRSLHAMAGYFAFLLASQCLELVEIARRHHLILSDFVRVISIYYLFTVFDEIVSPASDYFMTTLILYITIRWLDLYAVHERSFLPHALLCMVAFFAGTIKLSAAPFVLLSIYPVKRLIFRRKKEAIKPILYFVGMALIITVPYLIRNVILTGWLIYPFAGINLFNVSWKVTGNL